VRLGTGISFLLIANAFGQDLPKQAFDILQKNCFACHGSGLKMSGLDLRTRESILAGGERGEAMVPNYPERSRLYLFATHEQKPTMPPEKTLADAELKILEQWISAGAPWPAAANAAGGDAQAALAAMEERPITEDERKWWAFRPVARVDPPANGESHPVDAFLRAGWDKHAVKPVPPAAKRTLIRRAYLDLHGLPPSPEEVKTFLDDNSPDAWEKLVDRLLASPRYGERWARQWMDLVRYADSGGYEFDRDRNNAWRYRDWLVQAFNRDIPYDRFVKLQLAGDEYEPESAEARIAAGYLRLGAENNIKTEMTRMDELDDLLSTTSLTFLGMTVGCARCHNHKFDPIPQKDYYRMQAVFFSTRPQEWPLAPKEEVERQRAENKRIDDLEAPHKKTKEQLEEPHRKQLFEEKVSALPEYMQVAWRTPAAQRTEGQRLNARQIERTLVISEKDIVARMSADEKTGHEAAVAAIRSLEKQRPKPYASAMSISERGREPLPSYFLHRGSPSNKGSQMKAGGLTVAGAAFPESTPPEDAASSWRRRNFAEWVASPANPLTTRVMVNRIWQRHFGEGIVRSPSNFGKTGERPTHPELLDWLASEFVRSGWSIKKLDRLLMMSRAYRLSSADTPDNAKKDGDNRWVWRMGRNRLEVETIRDAILTAAGTLDFTMGGEGVLPYIDPALFQASSRRTWNGKPDDDSSTWRRSVYVFAKRTIRYPLFEAFDQPDTMLSCARRNRSTTAPQALLLMNNAMVRLQARKFSERLLREAGSDIESQVRHGFELALARQPAAGELAESMTLVRSGANGLADFCHALFNLNEFVYRE
jgi:mono/diheme cytochrome c family protein